MDLVDRVNAALAESRGAAPAEARTIGGTPWTPWLSPLWRFDAGGPVHPSRAGVGGVDSALRLAPVYSSVRILAEGCAMLPWQQFRDLGDRKQKMPLGQLLAKPSEFISPFDWKFQYVSSAALQGTAVGLITSRDGYGFPTTVEWLPSEDVTADDPRPWNPARAKIFFAGRLMQREDLLIVPAFTVPGRTLGISPIRYFQSLIESGLNALEYGDSWFRGGGFPPGTFQNTQYTVTDEQSKAIKRKLVEAQRRREPLVYGSDWDYKPVTVPPNEAQFIESMQLTATQIAAIYGVPPNRVGGVRGDSMTYSNVESESIGLISDTLDPWLVRLETALQECLPGQQYAQFNRNARLRTTAETRWNVYRAMRDIGAANVNEIRELEDREPLPKPRDDNDYDGSDYTPLQIMVAAARGLKEEIGTGPEGAPNPQVPPSAPKPPVIGPGGVLGQFQPKPVPAGAVNGNGRA